MIAVPRSKLPEHRDAPWCWALILMVVASTVLADPVNVALNKPVAVNITCGTFGEETYYEHTDIFQGYGVSDDSPQAIITVDLLQVCNQFSSYFSLQYSDQKGICPTGRISLSIRFTHNCYPILSSACQTHTRARAHTHTHARPHAHTHAHSVH